MIDGVEEVGGAEAEGEAAGEEEGAEIEGEVALLGEADGAGAIGGALAAITELGGGGEGVEDASRGGEIEGELDGGDGGDRGLVREAIPCLGAALGDVARVEEGEGLFEAEAAGDAGAGEGLDSKGAGGADVERGDGGGAGAAVGDEVLGVAEEGSQVGITREIAGGGGAGPAEGRFGGVASLGEEIGISGDGGGEAVQLSKGGDSRYEPPEVASRSRPRGPISGRRAAGRAAQATKACFPRLRGQSGTLRRGRRRPRLGG
ncbi:MAG: hypothetical protein R3B70_31490 [Polyangiaceae bacterium]